MSLKSSIILSLIVHSLLFIKPSATVQKIKTQQVKINLDTKTYISEKTLKKHSSVKTNTISTQLPNKASKPQGASYHKRLILFVQSKAVYPKSALSLKQEGTVIMTITIAKSGDVLDFKITKESAFSSLNFATLKLAKKIIRYKPFPEELGSQKVFTIPVNYILN